jgi:hypothetical protein
LVRALELPRAKRFQDATQMKAALMERSPLRISEVVHPAALMIPARGAKVRSWILLILTGAVVLGLAGVTGVMGRELLAKRISPETPAQAIGTPEVAEMRADVTPTVIPTLAPTVVPIETPLATETTTGVGATPGAELPVDWTLALSDPFDDNSNDWVVGEYDDDWGAVTRVITEGLYTWDITALQSVGRWCLPEIAPESDSYVAVEAQRTAGPVDASYGIVFRHSEGSYYLFSIRDDGFFNFNLWYGFEWVAVIDWTGTYAIRPGEVNRLAVRIEGSRFTFYINDEVVAQAENEELTAGETGLSVLLVTPGDAIFVFDNFEIRVP